MFVLCHLANQAVVIARQACCIVLLDSKTLDEITGAGPALTTVVTMQTMRLFTLSVAYTYDAPSVSKGS